MKHIRLPFVAAAVMLALPSATAHAASLCDAGEATVFNCRAKGKTLSICARHAASGALLYAQYRFGRGHPQISIPPRNPFDLTVFRGQTSVGTGASTTTLTVRNGDVVYEIDAVSNFRIAPGVSDETGISVTQDGRLLARFACDRDGPTDGLHEFITRNRLEAPEDANR